MKELGYIPNICLLYTSASEADQSEILMRYCSVINAWPDDAYVQVLTNNRRIDPVEFENTMLMHLRGDDMDRLREEYNQICLLYTSRCV